MSYFYTARMVCGARSMKRSGVPVCLHSSIDSSSGVQWVCCWAPRGQEISVDRRRRCSAANAGSVTFPAAGRGRIRDCFIVAVCQRGASARRRPTSSATRSRRSTDSTASRSTTCATAKTTACSTAPTRIAPSVMRASARSDSALLPGVKLKGIPPDLRSGTSCLRSTSAKWPLENNLNVWWAYHTEIFRSSALQQTTRQWCHWWFPTTSCFGVTNHGRPASLWLVRQDRATINSGSPPSCGAPFWRWSVASPSEMGC